MLRFQVTLNPLPLPLSGPGWALTAPELLTIVSSSSGNVVITPEFTVAPVSVQVPKLASGRMEFPLLGASAIHSALELAQVEQLWLVEKLLAGWVESVTLRV